MSDLISRQALCEYALNQKDKSVTPNDIMRFPSAHPGCGEWCTDCKEYDQQKHSCPRWNRVIKQTVEDVRKETPETTRILAEVLNGSPLLYPCDKLWSREGWCKDNCKAGQQEPDTECWLKYAEVMAAERRDE